MTTDIVRVADHDRWQQFRNPFLTYLQRNVEYEDWGSFWLSGWCQWGVSYRNRKNFESSRRVRHWLAVRYSWAIPDEQSIRMIAKHGPVVEIGAGTGYWAWLLTQVGCDVVCYDKNVPDARRPWITYEDMNDWEIMTPEELGRPWHCDQEAFHSINYGLPIYARKHPDRTLFLCWPLYDSPFAAECLHHYRGDTVAYVGEDLGGCTGDDSFFYALSRDWEMVEEHEYMPHWSGIRDHLRIYKRRK